MPGVICHGRFESLLRREIKKTPYINVMAQHEDSITGEFLYFKCVVSVCFINSLIVNYTIFNYLKFSYAQFLTSLSTTVFIFLSS